MKEGDISELEKPFDPKAVREKLQKEQMEQEQRDREERKEDPEIIIEHVEEE